MDDLTHAIESRLAAAGWRLPAPPPPRGSYAPYHLAALDGATLACVSGQASRLDGVPIVGQCQPGQDPTRQRLGRDRNHRHAVI